MNRPIDLNEEKEEVRFIIIMTNKGNVNLEGVPDSAVLAYGLLDIAAEIIASNRMMARLKGPKVVQAPPGWVPPTRKRPMG